MLPLAWAVLLRSSTSTAPGLGDYAENGVVPCSQAREAWSDKQDDLFSGPVEVDETYIGGKEKNKHASKKQFDRGTQGKATVMGAKQRDGKVFARPLARSRKKRLQTSYTKP